MGNSNRYLFWSRHFVDVARYVKMYKDTGSDTSPYFTCCQLSVPLDVLPQFSLCLAAGQPVT